MSACKKEGCLIPARKECRGYCGRCFITTYPGEKISRHYRVIQKAVGKFLSQEFNRRNITIDPLYSGEICLQMSSKTIFIQVVHNLFPKTLLHSSYTIYFNVGEYISTDGNKHPSCWSISNKFPKLLASRLCDWQHRLSILKETILMLSTESQLHLFFSDD